MNSDKEQENHSRLHASHDTCIVCGEKNPFGLKVSFRLTQKGGVEAEFMPKFAYEGYKGLLQGGVIASLMDSAMTNCLFYHGVSAFTAELSVKYRKPVHCGRKMLVTAKIEKSWNPLHFLSSSMFQEGELVAEATAKFMESDLLEKK
ncbi:MAG: PaaI family thioesterase [Elusimicrobia bacterium]|jgi:acyl-coenzyme A thioesterase PaaI-like protein|nr:PaaI family thioesterase [Elusimicrobiota bacterium]